MHAVLQLDTPHLPQLLTADLICALQENRLLGKMQAWMEVHSDDMQQLGDWLHAHIKLPNLPDLNISLNGGHLQLPALGEWRRAGWLAGRWVKQTACNSLPGL